MRTIAAILFSSFIVSLALAVQEQQPSSTPAPSQPAASKSAPGEQKAVPPSNSLGLVVARAVIAKGLDENGPVDPGTDFALGVKKLYCITQIKGAKDTVRIEHRWFLNDSKIFTLALPIKSVNWRTQSCVTIIPDRVGSWKVDVVLLPKEELLTSLNFTVK